MTRGEAKARGFIHVWSLVLDGSNPPELLCRPSPHSSTMTTTDERKADFWVRRIDAEEMMARVELITGLKWNLALCDVDPEETKPPGLLHTDDERSDCRRLSGRILTEPYA